MSRLIVELDEDSSESRESIELSRVRKILQAYENDIHEYNRALEDTRLGKVLTIVDSAFSDPEQRKAVKDLIKDSWYSSRPSGKFYNGFPRLHHVTEILGFHLWEEGTLVKPANVDINPYEDIK